MVDDDFEIRALEHDCGELAQLCAGASELPSKSGLRQRRLLARDRDQLVGPGIERVGDRLEQRSPRPCGQFRELRGDRRRPARDLIPLRDRATSS
jgi:hypothetical protein